MVFAYMLVMSAVFLNVSLAPANHVVEIEVGKRHGPPAHFTFRWTEWSDEVTRVLVEPCLYAIFGKDSVPHGVKFRNVVVGDIVVKAV